MDPTTQINPDAAETQETSCPPSFTLGLKNPTCRWSTTRARTCAQVNPDKRPGLPAAWKGSRPCPPCCMATQDQTAKLYLPTTSTPNKADEQQALPSEWPHFSSRMVYYLPMLFLSLRHSRGIRKWCQLRKQAVSLLVLSFLKYLLVSGNLHWSRTNSFEYQTRVIDWSLSCLKKGTTFYLSVELQHQGLRLAHSRTAKWEAVWKLHRFWN